MKVKTRELFGNSLNYAVAVARGAQPERGFLDYTQHLDVIHEVMMNRKISVGAFTQMGFDGVNGWFAYPYYKYLDHVVAPDPSTAILRCFVLEELGEEVDIPEEFV